MIDIADLQNSIYEPSLFKEEPTQVKIDNIKEGVKDKVKQIVLTSSGSFIKISNNILRKSREIYNTFANHKPYDQDNESDYFSSFDDDTLGSAGSGWTSLGTLSQRGNDG